MSLPIESVPEIVFSTTLTTQRRLQAVGDYDSGTDTYSLANELPFDKEVRPNDEGHYEIGDDSLVYFVRDGIAVCRDTYFL